MMFVNNLALVRYVTLPSINIFFLISVMCTVTLMHIYLIEYNKKLSVKNNTIDILIDTNQISSTPILKLS